MNNASDMAPIRYCPECGHIGSVDNTKFKNCCPDGNLAVDVPRAVAMQAQAGLSAILAQESRSPVCDMVNAIKRAASLRSAEADAIAKKDQFDYSAEFPAEDARLLAGAAARLQLGDTPLLLEVNFALMGVLEIANQVGIRPGALTTAILERLAARLDIRSVIASDPPAMQPQLADIPDVELPGMWERADFLGGKDEERLAPPAMQNVLTEEECEHIHAAIEMLGDHETEQRERGNDSIAAGASATRFVLEKLFRLLPNRVSSPPAPQQARRLTEEEEYQIYESVHWESVQSAKSKLDNRTFWHHCDPQNVTAPTDPLDRAKEIRERIGDLPPGVSPSPEGFGALDIESPPAGTKRAARTTRASYDGVTTHPEFGGVAHVDGMQESIQVQPDMHAKTPEGMHVDVVQLTTAVQVPRVPTLAMMAALSGESNPALLPGFTADWQRLLDAAGVAGVSQDAHGAAVATLMALGYTFHGGDFWQPPAGVRPVGMRPCETNNCADVPNAQRCADCAMRIGGDELARARLAEQRADPIGELAMMVRRLCSKTPDGQPRITDATREQALELLRKHDLLGSPLRADDSGVRANSETSSKPVTGASK